MAVIDVFETGAGVSQFCPSQSTGHAPVITHGEFAVDEQAETLFEGECLDVSGVKLFGEGVSHTDELKGVQFIEGGMVKHGMCISLGKLI